MSNSPSPKPLRNPPTRLIFRSNFCFWSKPRLPPSVASAVLLPISPDNSGGGAVVVPNGPSASSNATNLTGFESRDGFLRRYPILLKGWQRPVILPLVGSLPVVVDSHVFVQDVAQPLVINEPQSAHALGFDCPHVAFSERIYLHRHLHPMRTVNQEPLQLDRAQRHRRGVVRRITLSLPMLSTRNAA